MTIIKGFLIGGLLVVIIGALVFAFWSWNSAPSSTSLSQTAKNIILGSSTTAAPKRIGLQVGHLNIANVPPELSNYQWDLGAQVGQTTEVSLNYEVANETATILRQQGYIVDILTATVPPDYKADAVVAIHADDLPDGDTTTSGFEVGASAYDTSGKASTLAEEIDRAYSNTTGLSFWPAISDAMTSYYSFDHNSFVHSVNPNSPAVLIELGFISNDQDRNFLIDNSQTAAQGLAQGIEDFLNNKSIAGLNYPTSSTEDTQTSSPSAD